MLTLLPEELATYVEDHAPPEPALLAELKEATYATLEDPQMQVGRVEGALLRMLAMLLGARRVIEIGTFSGYSTLSLAAGVPEGGRVITCDIDPVATDLAKTFWARSAHGHKIELRLGPAIETLRSMSDDAPVDLAFIDADKTSYEDYWEALVPMMRPGGLILADNALWSGKVLHPQDPSDHALVSFNARVRADSRVDAVLLSVRDGIMAARKRDEGDPGGH
ncbi:MAG: O-methyltransferase [Nannocystaceae bacterium]|nr:class I SAM-dependent methyltransferase [bacterium]